MSLKRLAPVFASIDHAGMAGAEAHGKDWGRFLDAGKVVGVSLQPATLGVSSWYPSFLTAVQAAALWWF